jgi:hypothetical protein
VQGGLDLIYIWSPFEAMWEENACRAGYLINRDTRAVFAMGKDATKPGGFRSPQTSSRGSVGFG